MICWYVCFLTFSTYFQESGKWCQWRNPRKGRFYWQKKIEFVFLHSAWCSCVVSRCATLPTLIPDSSCVELKHRYIQILQLGENWAKTREYTRKLFQHLGVGEVTGFDIRSGGWVGPPPVKKGGSPRTQRVWPTWTNVFNTKKKSPRIPSWAFLDKFVKIVKMDFVGKHWMDVLDLLGVSICTRILVPLQSGGGTSRGRCEVEWILVARRLCG